MPPIYNYVGHLYYISTLTGIQIASSLEKQYNNEDQLVALMNLLTTLEKMDLI